MMIIGAVMVVMCIVGCLATVFQNTWFTIAVSNHGIFLRTINSQSISFIPEIHIYIHNIVILMLYTYLHIPIRVVYLLQYILTLVLCMAGQLSCGILVLFMRAEVSADIIRILLQYIVFFVTWHGKHCIKVGFRIIYHWSH